MVMVDPMMLSSEIAPTTRIDAVAHWGRSMRRATVDIATRPEISGLIGVVSLAKARPVRASSICGEAYRWMSQMSTEPITIATTRATSASTSCRGRRRSNNAAETPSGRAITPSRPTQRVNEIRMSGMRVVASDKSESSPEVIARGDVGQAEEHRAAKQCHEQTEQVRGSAQSPGRHVPLDDHGQLRTHRPIVAETRGVSVLSDRGGCMSA